MGVTVGATWAGVESVVSAGDKAVGIYNAGGVASGQALTDAAIGLMAAASALASNFPMGSLAAMSDVVNSINQLNITIVFDNPGTSGQNGMSC